MDFLRNLLGSTTPAPKASPPIPVSVKENLVELKNLLLIIDFEINKIESKESRTESEGADKIRLNDFQKIRFDAENLIDDIEHEILVVESPASPGKRKRDEVSAFDFISSSSSSSSSSVGSEFDWGEMEGRMHDIQRSYGRVRHQSKALGLKKGDGTRRTLLDGRGETARPPTGSLSSARQIFGRKKELEKIIGAITKKRDEVIFPIVGSPGIGKTAFVQHVFDDKSVKNSFDLRAWVFVPESFDVDKLTLAVFESVARRSADSDNLSDVQNELKQYLEGKRLLLVLDDVWNVDKMLWHKFWTPLASVIEENVVLIVTREYCVPESMPEEIKQMQALVLKPLDFVAANELFWSQLSPVEGQEMVPNYREVIEKCKGLPSALKKAASTFARNSGGKIWYHDVLLGDIWDLKSSYRRLPAHLKHCIALCSLYPENYRFDKVSLVRFWIAVGAIQKEDNKDLEDVGSGYFDKLWSRSFFVYSSHDDQFVMPILVDSLLQSTSKYSRTECKDETVVLHSSPDVRHLAHILRAYNTKKRTINCRHLLQQKTLCSLLTISPDGYKMKTKIDLSSLSELKYLRVLNLSHTDLEELPDSIANLKYLRILGLNATKVKMLPESICKLLYMQTLELKCCRRLERIPQDIGKMITLRHIVIDDDTSFCFPAGFGELTGLQTLSVFNVGKADGFAGIKEIYKLENLRKELYIRGLRNVANVDDCRVLGNKAFIQKLTLVWPPSEQEELYNNDDDDDDDDWNLSDEEELNSEYKQIQYDHPNFIGLDGWSEDRPQRRSRTIADVDVEEVIERLRPHDNLEILAIKSYNGCIFPKWLGDQVFLKLWSITLEDCKNCYQFPSLGQLPELKYLAMERMNFTEILEKQESNFPKLEELVFKQLYKWEKWSVLRAGGFRKLKKVGLFNCPKLTEMPSFSCLNELDLENCRGLKALPELPELKRLKLIACDGLVTVPNLNSLTDLTLMSCKMPALLQQVSALQKIWLEDCGDLMPSDLNCSLCRKPLKVDESSNLLVGNCQNCSKARE